MEDSQPHPEPKERGGRISRRAFLAAAAGLLGGGSLLAASAVTRRRLAARMEHRLLALFPEPELIRPIGEEYLKLHPEERASGTLLRVFLRDLGPLVALGSETHLRQRVAERVRDDFDQARTVRVEGWILSGTEARLSALVALSPSAPKRA